MLSFFPRHVLDEILNLTESVSEGFSYLLLQSVYYLSLLFISVLGSISYYKYFKFVLVLFIYFFILVLTVEFVSSTASTYFNRTVFCLVIMCGRVRPQVIALDSV